MKEYLILIAAQDQRGLTTSEEQKCIQDYGQWAEKLGQKYITGRRLSLEAGDLLPSKKSVTTDGPFVEAKELIAGFVLVSADSSEDAKSIAASCPLNEHFHLYVKEVN